MGLTHPRELPQYAIDLAERFEAELIVLYIIDPRYKEIENALSPRPGRLKELTIKVIEVGEKIVDIVKENAVEKNVNVKTDVINGVASITKGIVDYAKFNKVNLIVIGSRGITGFKKLLVGSVASGVVTYSDCPVLVIK
ncbi:MAG TPA: universal stress protein [Nitrososphaeraceae archaeon]|nr:universal stress protein [Nitrososphaeraceae archaeon]